MNAQEHFQAAEKLLQGQGGFAAMPGAKRDAEVAKAQVHAILALAAATAEADGKKIHDTADSLTEVEVEQSHAEAPKGGRVW